MAQEKQQGQSSEAPGEQEEQTSVNLETNLYQVSVFLWRGLKALVLVGQKGCSGVQKKEGF